MTMRSTIALVFVIIMTTMADDLPANFKICSKSDSQWKKCIGEAAEITIQLMAKGLPNFKILPIEPLQINRIKIGDNNSSMSLQYEYWNIEVHGISKGIKIKAEIADLAKNVYVLNGWNPQVDFIANYRFNGRGKILLLPIYGEGKCNISMHNVFTKHEVHFGYYEKNGEIYLKVVKYLFKLNPKLVKIAFENLFNGNAILGKEMNRIINENWEVVFKEYLESFEETFAIVFEQIISKLFNRIPSKKFLLP